MRAEKFGRAGRASSLIQQGIRKMRKLMTFLIGVSGLAVSAPAMAVTTVLTFDGFACTGTDGGAVDRNCVNQNDIIGSNYGSTAQLAVSYDAADHPQFAVTSLRYGFPFGGSSSVAVSAFGGPDGRGYSSITFTPTAGFEVAFNSFRWQRGSATFAEIAADLMGPGGATLASFTGSSGGTFTPNTSYYAGPLTFRFSTPTSGIAVVDDITFDVRGIASPPGGVPEPASWALMVAGFGLTGSALRNANGRRRKTSAQFVLA
jgi:hypothetical protein